MSNLKAKVVLISKEKEIGMLPSYADIGDFGFVVNGHTVWLDWLRCETSHSLDNEDRIVSTNELSELDVAAYKQLWKEASEAIGNEISEKTITASLLAGSEKIKNVEYSCYTMKGKVENRVIMALQSFELIDDNGSIEFSKEMIDNYNAQE